MREGQVSDLTERLTKLIAGHPHADMNALQDVEKMEEENRLLRSHLRFALREAKRTPFNADEYDVAASLIE